MLFKLAIVIVLMAGWQIPLTQAEDLAASAMIAGEQYGVAPERVVAMMWVESRFKTIKGDGGRACGVLQAHPEFTNKPGGGTYTCEELLDPLTGTLAGVEMLSRWKRTKGSRALTHYNSGNRATAQGQAYQRYVEFKEKRVRRYLNAPEHLGHVGESQEALKATPVSQEPLL